jgi:VanZ like family
MVLNAEKGRPNVATGREVLGYSIPRPFFTEVMIHPESQRGRVAATRIIQILCVCVVCIVLVAGLWPFHAPKNNVSWIAGENGLHFERYGTAVTSNPFHPGGSNGESSCSLEIWLVPGPSRKGTILAFGDAGDSRVSLSLLQVGDDLAIVRYLVDAQGNVTRPWLTIESVFRGGPVFMTVTSGRAGTLVYIDGLLAKASSEFGLERKDLFGRLVLATSTTNNSWTGNVLGLAIYSKELSDEQVSRHFHSWASAQGPALAASEAPEALYLFNERAGKVAHNEHDPDTNLIIPAHYLVLRNPLLQAPWGNYRGRWSAAHYRGYWQDVGINVVGFMPVGFCFVAYFSSVKRWQRPVALAVFLGFILSLTIEVLQALLPTRDSGMTDVITNTAGTALGTMLYRCSLIRHSWTAAVESASSFLS